MKHNYVEQSKKSVTIKSAKIYQEEGARLPMTSRTEHPV